MRTFHFYQVYKMSSIVEQLAEDSSFLLEMPWEESRILECLIKPSKASLLHWYIYTSIEVVLTKQYRKDNDSIEEEDTQGLEAAFKSYGIKVKPFDEFCAVMKFDEDYDELGEQFYQWFDSEFEAFHNLWTHQTDEIFYILFGNRSFLLKFNISLSEYLEDGQVEIPSSFLNERGHLKRCSHLPIWLRKAIYFRDQGRCVFCQKDLSGLLSTDRRLHYDHIVPLYRWGTNDPSNFQLLCEACNLNKSKRPGVTSNKYPPWW